MSAKKVMIVEDSFDMRHLLKTLLLTEGHQVVECEKVAEARVALALDRSFDLVVLDVSLEDGSGFDLAKSLHDEGREDLRICFVTGSRTLEDVKRAVELGAKDYVVKPINPFQFLDKIRRILAAGPAAPRSEEAFVTLTGEAAVLGLPIELNVSMRRISTGTVEFVSAVFVKNGTELNLAVASLSTAAEDGGLLPVTVMRAEAQDGGHLISARIRILSSTQRNLIDSHVRRGAALGA